VISAAWSAGFGQEVFASPALLVSWCSGGDGVGRGKIPAGDGGGAEPLGGVLGLHRHLQQGPHDLPWLQLWYEIQSWLRCFSFIRC
jgi:hypothetical protein